MWNSETFPPGPLSTGLQNILTATIGNIYYGVSSYSAGIFDLLGNLRTASGVTDQDVVGNSILLQKIKCDLALHFNESQSTSDQGYVRVTVVQAKDGAMPLPVTGFTMNNENLAQSVFLGSLATPYSIDSKAWMTLPIDLKRFDLLYDKVQHRHATPISVTAQANCHFKTVHYKIRFSWPRGKSMQLSQQNTTGNVIGRWVRPIFMIVQAGEDTDGMLVTPNLTVHSNLNSKLYVTWRDA